VKPVRVLFAGRVKYECGRRAVSYLAFVLFGIASLQEKTAIGAFVTMLGKLQVGGVNGLGEGEARKLPPPD
jgi:hypothetical protein